ncbi:hypothetical protein POVWA2_051150 [Plasmodium ovale wallikeri]|uniref:Uncharacterized protein n=1 Tax=Plasmodium ovale wallikeri TaxID=864142 RepID=A0A1A8ZQA2_PLAOA|nr:hypothetical protein POVWA2_051150 [Plasmodium ovale wallikeri]
MHVWKCVSTCGSASVHVEVLQYMWKCVSTCGRASVHVEERQYMWKCVSTYVCTPVYICLLRIVGGTSCLTEEAVMGTLQQWLCYAAFRK